MHNTTHTYDWHKAQRMHRARRTILNLEKDRGSKPCVPLPFFPFAVLRERKKCFSTPHPPLYFSHACGPLWGAN